MNIQSPRSRLLAALLAGCTLALAGCATTGYSDPYYSGNPYGSDYYGTAGGAYNNQVMGYGTVESMRQVALRDTTDGVGAGAVLGAIVGGAIGNQMGDGSGRTAATVAGAAVGGYLGDKIQDSRGGSGRTGVEVVVRLDNGQRVAVVQDARYTFYRGQRVRITGSGSSAQVVPQ